jgi:myo-inositol 2-dehydrogenase/D-chiro-inositol 1-dehydrogenase
MTSSDRVRLGLIGAGYIGRFHAETIARRLPDAQLVVVADPVEAAARDLASRFGAEATADPADVVGAPHLDGVVIAAPARFHADLVVEAADVGTAVFCEKPMALDLTDADRAIAAAEAAGVPLQVGFQRRFAADFRAARDAVEAGAIGSPQLLRSLTRDPGLADPGRVPPWTIFRETLIHDFDVLLWLNPGAAPVSVFAMADALVAPAFKENGLLDTSAVLIRFDNGAIATAEANFSASYGYDVRAEAFGSDGMVTAGSQEHTAMRLYTEAGMTQQTVRANTDLFFDAYTAELAHFVECVRTGTIPSVTGRDARGALAIALAAMESVRSGGPVDVGAVEARA